MPASVCCGEFFYFVMNSIKKLTREELMQKLKPHLLKFNFYESLPDRDTMFMCERSDMELEKLLDELRQYHPSLNL